jgi:formyl-CoA transferase
MSFTPASKALARFKVLDLTRVRAGPTAARQFADWGADVIKIELPPGSTKAIWAGRGTDPISRTFIATSEASRST